MPVLNCPRCGADRSRIAPLDPCVVCGALLGPDERAGRGDGASVGDDEFTETTTQSQVDAEEFDPDKTVAVADRDEHESAEGFDPNKTVADDRAAEEAMRHYLGEAGVPPASGQLRQAASDGQVIFDGQQTLDKGRSGTEDPDSEVTVRTDRSQLSRGGDLRDTTTDITARASNPFFETGVTTQEETPLSPAPPVVPPPIIPRSLPVSSPGPEDEVLTKTVAGSGVMAGRAPAHEQSGAPAAGNGPPPPDLPQQVLDSGVFASSPRPALAPVAGPPMPPAPPVAPPGPGNVAPVPGYPAAAIESLGADTGHAVDSADNMPAVRAQWKEAHPSARRWAEKRARKTGPIQPRPILILLGLTLVGLGTWILIDFLPSREPVEGASDMWRFSSGQYLAAQANAALFALLGAVVTFRGLLNRPPAPGQVTGMSRWSTFLIVVFIMLMFAFGALVLLGRFG